MKIVNIIGGLGNQMFQYALAVSLKKRFPNEEVLIDTSHFHYLFSKKWKGTNLHNGYEISKVFPNADLKRATPLQLMKVTWYMPNYVLSRLIRKYLLRMGIAIMKGTGSPKNFLLKAAKRFNMLFCMENLTKRIPLLLRKWSEKRVLLSMCEGGIIRRVPNGAGSVP